MEREIKGLKDLKAFAQELIPTLPPGKRGARVVALYGELGSGKTTFVKYAAEALGVEEVVVSPTFILERVYKLPDSKAFQRLVHIDCYRLEGAHDLASLGWKELVDDPRNIIFIEWAERVGEALPDDAVKIYFEVVGDNERKITTLNYEL